MLDTSLFIPVILGTPRKGRQSEYVAKFLVEQIAAHDRLNTELIDIRNIAIATDDAGGLDTELIDIRNIAIATDDAGESIKDPEFSATMERADGPEMATRMGADAMETVLQVSLCPQTGEIEATPIT